MAMRWRTMQIQLANRTAKTEGHTLVNAQDNRICNVYAMPCTQRHDIDMKHGNVGEYCDNNTVHSTACYQIYMTCN